MKILIVTGRTGGHFFPAKTFAEAFKREHSEAEIHYVLSRRTSGNLLEEEINNSESVYYLPSFPWRGILTPKIFIFLISLSKALFMSFKLLRNLRPNLVVGFGSYLAFPILVCARIQNIPSLIHEQNAVMGKANKALLPFVTQVAVSFSDTIDPKFPEKFVHTGNIIRSDLFIAANSKRQPMNGHFRILVLGGSQGASELNKLVTQALTEMDPVDLNRIRMTHLTGASDCSWVKEKYEGLGIQARVEAFSRDMGRLYQETDLLISRSGAGTLFESVLFQLPAILIPYPYAGSHQYENAQALTRAGNSWMLDQKKVKPLELANKISELIHFPAQIENAKNRLRHILKVDDGENLARVATRIINRNMNTEVRCESAYR